MTTTRIGRHAITPVLDSVVRPPAGAVYSNTPPAVLATHPELLTADGRVELFMGGYLLHTGGRVVLVDVGVGPDGWRAPSGAFIPGGYFLENLRVAGVEPDAVTDVVLTHLHPDHIGWAGREGIPSFPNATYRCHRNDWTHFMEGGDASGDVTTRTLLAPLADRFELWERSGTLFPGVDLVDTPGHTPGSTTIVLSGDDGSRALLLGDVVHCPVELLEDEWGTFGDVDPVMANATRLRMAAELEGSPALIGAAHFAALRFGRLLPSATGRRWQPVAPAAA